MRKPHVESNQQRQQSKRLSGATFLSAQTHPLPHSYFESISNAARLLVRSYHHLASCAHASAPQDISATGLGRSRLCLLWGTLKSPSLSPFCHPLTTKAFCSSITAECSCFPPPSPSLPCLCSVPLARLTQPGWKSVQKKETGLLPTAAAAGFEARPRC